MLAIKIIYEEFDVLVKYIVQMFKKVSQFPWFSSFLYFLNLNIQSQSMFILINLTILLLLSYYLYFVVDVNFQYFSIVCLLSLCLTL